MRYSAELIAELAQRHGITGTPEPMAAMGMINDAWRIGDHVLRICATDGCEGEAANEARVVPLAIAHGVRTPALVAIGEAPRPYTIYRFAREDRVDPGGGRLSWRSRARPA